MSSSKVPALHLIPTEALICLAERFEVGTERKGEGAWNALTKNQQCLDDKAFLIERCSHIIRHTMLLRDQLAHGYTADQEDSPYENAGAIIFGGALMACAMHRRGECVSCGLPFTEAGYVACPDCVEYGIELVVGTPAGVEKCGEVRLDPTTDAWIPAREWDGAADVADGGAKCVRCGCHVASGMPACNPCIDYVKNHTAPVVTFESPDDWVVQDRVPARHNDRGAWVDIGEEYPPYDFSSRHWWTVGDKADQKLEHGSVDVVGRTLHLICRRKDLPPITPPAPAETGQSLCPPHADATFLCKNHGVVSGLEFSPAQKMWFWKNRSDVCWDLYGKACRISLDLTDTELRGFDIIAEKLR